VSGKNSLAAKIKNIYRNVVDYCFFAAGRVYGKKICEFLFYLLK
jgi:hypothetical protein